MSIKHLLPFVFLAAGSSLVAQVPERMTFIDQKPLTLTLVNPAMRIEPTKRIVFDDAVDPDTVVCWKGFCKRLLEVWPQSTPLWWGSLTEPSIGAQRLDGFLSTCPVIGEVKK